MKFRYYEFNGAVFRGPDDFPVAIEVKVDGEWQPYKGSYMAPVTEGNQIPAEEAGEREGDFGEECTWRDPRDFYDFGPFKKASKEYLDAVMPDELKALIEKRRKAKQSE